MITTRLARFIGAASCLALTASVFADTIRWINPAGGTFSDGANWLGGTPPGPNDIARFDLIGTYTVAFSQDAATAIAVIEGDVTFDLAGRTVTLGRDEVSGVDVMPLPDGACTARFQSGTVHLITGGFLAIDGHLIFDGVTVTDPEFSATMQVGEGGVLIVTNTSSFAARTLYLFGGEVLIDAGATLQTQWLLCSSPSDITATGVGTFLRAQALTIEGNFNIINGAMVGFDQEPPPLLHIYSGMTTIDGPSSRMIASGALYGGSMSVTNGGRFINPRHFEAHGDLTLSATAMLSGDQFSFYSTPRVSFDSIIAVQKLQLLSGMEIDIDGLSTRTTPLVQAMSGTLFDGSLTVTTHNPNALAPGRTFPILGSGSNLAGFFTSFTAPTLNGGRTITLQQTPNIAPVTLTIERSTPSCYSPDFNADSQQTPADIEAFFACLAGRCCPTCPTSADFDGDADPGTDADIEAFFRTLAGGPC